MRPHRSYHKADNTALHIWWVLVLSHIDATTVRVTVRYVTNRSSASPAKRRTTPTAQLLIFFEHSTGRSTTHEQDEDWWWEGGGDTTAATGCAVEIFAAAAAAAAAASVICGVRRDRAKTGPRPSRRRCSFPTCRRPTTTARSMRSSCDAQRSSAAVFVFVDVIAPVQLIMPDGAATADDDRDKRPLNHLDGASAGLEEPLLHGGRRQSATSGRWQVLTSSLLTDWVTGCENPVTTMTSSWRHCSHCDKPRPSGRRL